MALYSWSKRELGAQYEYVWSSFYDPSNGYIYIGTANDSGDADLLVSYDNGDSFSLLWDFSGFNRVGAIWADGSNIIVGVGDFSTPKEGAIYKSSDGGSSWNKTLSVVNESNPEPWDICRSNSGRFFSSWSNSEAEAYYSDDIGDSWTKITLPDTTNYYLGNAILCLGNTVLVSVCDSRTLYETRVYRSIDNGQNWTFYQIPQLSKYNPCVVDNNGDIALLAEGVLYKSVDDGISFSPSTPSFASTGSWNVYSSSDVSIQTLINTNYIAIQRFGVWNNETVDVSINNCTTVTAISNNKILVGSGIGAGLGDVWIGTPLFPVVDFSADSTVGVTPLTVQFTDLSTNSPTSWEWKSGETILSTEQNPEIVFSNPGLYSITLTATNSSGTGTLTKTDYIMVSGGNTGIDYNGDSINFDLTKTIESTLSLPFLKMVDSVGNISYRRFSDDTTISASWPINLKNDRVENEVFGAYLGAYRWESYGIRFLLDPYLYTYQGEQIDFDKSISFSYDTGYAVPEVGSSDIGLCWYIGSIISGMSLVYIKNGTGGRVDFRHSGLTGVTTNTYDEWANGVNISGTLNLTSPNNVSFSATITGGGISETLTYNGTSSAVLGDFVFYNAGVDDGECRLYRFSVDDNRAVKPMPQWSLDSYISGQNYDTTGAQPVLTTYSDTFPLSPLYDCSSGQGVTIEMDNEGHRDFFGDITGYKYLITPAGTLTDADFTGQTSCTAEDWVLNGVGLPFPKGKGKFKPNINGSSRVTQSFGGYTDTISTERTQGDTTEVEVDCDVIKANELLKMLRDTDWSAGPVVARFAESYKPFGWRHGVLTMNVQLTDTKIKIKQTGPQTVIITFGLQYQGV